MSLLFFFGRGVTPLEFAGAKSIDFFSPKLAVDSWSHGQVWGY